MKKLTLTAAMISATVIAFAQQLPFSSQYYTNMFVINPAYTGTGDNTNAFITHRSQWTGIAGSPQTSYLTLDGPIEAKKIGLGMKLYSDATDITSRMGAFANYSYRLKINDDNSILLGLSAGILNNRIDFSKAVVRDTDDPFLFSKPQSKTVFSADFGLAYIWKKLEVGFCIPQLIGNQIKYQTVNGDNSYFNLSRHYQGSVKYVFDIIKEKEITAYPLIMLRAAEGAPVQYDINAVLDWKKIGWFGITYHSNYAMALSAGVRYKNLSVGYAYDIGVSKFKSYMGSSSEFLLGYVFGTNKKELIENTVQKEEPKNVVTDSTIAKLKEKSDANEFKIELLTSEVQQLQSTVSANSTPKNADQHLTENLMRTSEADEFMDEDGKPLVPGFYIVIGSYNNKENANKFKQANIIKGYTRTQIFQNNFTKVFYVFVSISEKKEDALNELKKYKIGYPDVWIQQLK